MAETAPENPDTAQVASPLLNDTQPSLESETMTARIDAPPTTEHSTVQDEPVSAANTTMAVEVEQKSEIIAYSKKMDSTSVENPEFTNLPQDQTLCHLLAWLFQRKGSEGCRPTSEFYQFRNLHPETKWEIRKTKLKEYCKSKSNYLCYVKATKTSETAVRATSKCNNPQFKEKLRRLSPSRKKAEDVWSTTPSILERTIQIIQSSPFRSEYDRSSLVNEWRKRSSSLSKKRIRDDDELKNSLLTSTYSLKEMAVSQKISTTQLAQALLDTENLEDSSNDLSPRKLQLLTEAKLLSSEDKLFGYLLNVDGKVKLKESGNFGEKLTMGDFDQIGIDQDAYQTEEVQRLALKTNDFSSGSGKGTPDFLFHTPIAIFGQEVSWIEVKNFVVIPELSLDDRVDRFINQVKRYLTSHGPGMVLFTREGFSQSLRDKVPTEIILATRIQSICKRPAVRNYGNFLSAQSRLLSALNFFDFPEVRLGVISSDHLFPSRKGHILGGSIDQEEYFRRIDEESKRTAHELSKKIDGEIKEDEEAYDENDFTMLHQLFKEPYQLLEEKCSRLDDCLTIIMKYKIEERGQKAIKLMKKAIENILQNPSVAKFQTINLKVKPFLGLMGVANFFQEIGFQPEDDERVKLVNSSDCQLLFLAMENFDKFLTA
jgi:hypothetical protein